MMIRDLHILTFAFLLSVTLSCDRKAQYESVEDSFPIEFSLADFSADVKGNELTDSSIENFGVYAALGDMSADFNEDAALVPFMANVRVAQNNGVWSAVPNHYWPVNKVHDISFFAYAPHLDMEAAEFSEDWSSHSIVMPFSPNSNPRNQVDLLIADAALDKYREEVVLDFNHALTWVSFGARYVSRKTPESESMLPEGAYLRVEEVALKGVTEKMNLVYGADGFYWDEGTAEGSSDYVLSLNKLTLADIALDENEFKEFASDEGALFLLPQEIDGDSVKLCFLMSAQPIIQRK